MGYYAKVRAEAIVGVIVGDRLFRGPHGEAVMALLRKNVPPRHVWVAEIDRTDFKIALRHVTFTN
jgi:hypothetical protein